MALPDPTRIDLARSIYGRMIAMNETPAQAAAVLAPQVGATPQDVRVALTYLRRGLATSEALDVWAHEGRAAPLSAALFEERRPAYQVGVRVVLDRLMPSGQVRQVSVYLPMTWDQPISAIADYVQMAHQAFNDAESEARLLGWHVVGPTRAPAPIQG